MKKTTLPVGMHDKLFKRVRVTYKIEVMVPSAGVVGVLQGAEMTTLESCKQAWDRCHR